MVLLILLVLALFVLQTLLPACFSYMGPGRKLMGALGPRDDPPPPSRVGDRAKRALANIQEAMPVFLALALLNLILGTGDLATTGATLFLIARVLYVPAYLAGVTGIRTLIWAASVVGLVMMLTPILARI